MNGRKRSAVIDGHATSFSLEDEFFKCLRLLAAQDGVPLSALVRLVDAGRDADTGLSSALRLHVLAAAREGRLGPDPKAADSAAV